MEGVLNVYENYKDSTGKVSGKKQESTGKVTCKSLVTPL